MYTTLFGKQGYSKSEENAEYIIYKAFEATRYERTEYISLVRQKSARRNGKYSNLFGARRAALRRSGYFIVARGSTFAPIACIGILLLC